MDFRVQVKLTGAYLLALMPDKIYRRDMNVGLILGVSLSHLKERLLNCLTVELYKIKVKIWCKKMKFFVAL